jgi:methanethiol S-methyltransferase
MVASGGRVGESGIGGGLAVLYGLAAYALFLVAFSYAIGFVGNFVVPKSIDSGARVPVGFALVVDALLLAVFAAQHSVMARPAFKRVWTRVVPRSVERSTYVLFSSAALLLLYWQWQPLPMPVWTIDAPSARFAIDALFWLGWAIVFTSTLLLDHFELFGLRQVFARLRRHALPPAEFRTPLYYRYVRHPIYLGFLIAFWSTPQMSVGHLVFAIATTGYILLGIALEERDLVAQFGDEYRRYCTRVRMLLPSAPRSGDPREGSLRRA